MTGIYMISNAVTGSVYIGSALNIETRWKEHRRRLRGGRHENSRLQRSWCKYGEAAFSLSVLAECASSALLHIEQWALDRALEEFGRDAVYNICPIARSRLGAKVSQKSRMRMSEAKRGTRASAEAREKMSAARRGEKRPAEIMEKCHAAHRGLRRSEEARAKMRAASARRDPSTWIKSPEHRAQIAAAMRGNSNLRDYFERRKDTQPRPVP